jgi:predicted nucleic acid-binding protein
MLNFAELLSKAELIKRIVVFDSNILIAWSKKKLDRDLFIRRFSGCKWIISEITEIELLSYSIRLRRSTNRKLPDAVIAATAVLAKATLISNDLHLLKAAYPGLLVESFV